MELRSIVLQVSASSKVNLLTAFDGLFAYLNVLQQL